MTLTRTCYGVRGRKGRSAEVAISHSANGETWPIGSRITTLKQKAAENRNQMASERQGILESNGFSVSGSHSLCNPGLLLPLEFSEKPLHTSYKNSSFYFSIISLRGFLSRIIRVLIINNHRFTVDFLQLLVHNH